MQRYHALLSFFYRTDMLYLGIHEHSQSNHNHRSNSYHSFFNRMKNTAIIPRLSVSSQILIGCWIGYGGEDYELHFTRFNCRRFFFFFSREFSKSQIYKYNYRLSKNCGRLQYFEVISQTSY